MDPNIPIFYINLDHRTDRREHMEKQFEHMGIDPTQIERFPGIIPVYDEIQTTRVQSFVDRGIYNTVDGSKGILGCTRSHLAVLKLAYAREHSYVLILEDDFELVVSPEVFREKIRQLFADPTFEFDVCMLSYNMPQSESAPDHPFLTRVSDAQTASGYLVARAYLPTLIACLTNAVEQLELTGSHWLYANDMAWKPLQSRDRWYAFTDRIGKQMDGYSDNRCTFVHYDC
jgi:GR25 family glycosyltransferase involved in LPS biosynthesis